MRLFAILLLLFVIVPVSAAEKEPRAVVLLSADWCAPCKQMKEIVEKFKQEGKPTRVVDVDKEPEVARAYGYPNGEGIPQTCIQERRRVITRFIGVVSETVLRRAAGYGPPK